MKGIEKKQARSAITKTISILVVIFLLSAAASTSVSARRFEDKSDDSSDRPVERLLESLSIGERLSSLRERMTSFLDRVRELKNDLKVDRSEIDIKDISALNNLGILSSSSSLQFYTNYDGIITETTLKIFRETKVDINADNVDDLGVRYTIGLGIADLGLSINFKFQFRKLEGYSSLREDAEFEGYVEIYFPGLLAQDLEGDRLRFGIESPEGEKIPEDLLMIYKFVPHLLSFKKKPGHMFYLNPGVDSGKCDLNLITSFAEMDGNSVVSEVKSKVMYDPIVESEIKISGERSLKDSKTEYTYERVRVGGSKVDLYVQFSEGSKSIVVYAKNLPNKVTYNALIEGNGKGIVEFNAYGDSVDEVGICDDFDEPVNRVFFSNMFEYAKLEWYTNLLGNGKANVSVYTEGSGASFNVHVEGEKGVADFSASPSGSIIDCSMELDTRVGYLVLNRNDLDIAVSFNVEITNESLAGYLSTLDGSFVLKKTGGKLEITFNDLFDGNATIHIAGKTLEVDDLLITGNSPILGGDFIVSMDYFKKEFMGDIISTLVVSQVENNISGNCSFEVIGGVNITGLLIKFGDFTIFDKDYVNVSYYWKNYVEFTVAVALVEWNVAPDFSSGYILIKSNSYLSFSFSSTYSDLNPPYDVLGEVSGSIRLKTTSDVFNISWGTVDGNSSMNFDGSGVVKLENFYLYLKDKVEVSIPLVKGTFDINTNDRTGELLLEVDPSTFEIHLDIDKINITGLFEITLKGSISLDIDEGSVDGFLYIAWNESGLSALETDFELGVIGTIEVTNFEFSYKQSFIDVSFDNLTISGDLTASIVKNEDEFSLVASGSLTEINVTGLQAYVGHQLLGVDIADISFSGGGEFSFILDNGDILATANLSGDDSEIIVNVLWIDAVMLALGFIRIEIRGPLTITIDLDTTSDDILLKLIIDPDEEDIYCEHVNLGPSIIELWDVSGGAGEGDYLGIYASIDHPSGIMGLMPVVHFDGLWYFKDVYLMLNPVVTNLTVEGSVSIEFWFDPIHLTYFYLNGVAYEETTINVLGIDVIIEPCNFNIMFQQNVFGYLEDFSMFEPGADWYFYIVADVHNWVTISLPNVGEIAKFYGYIDARIDVVIDDDDEKINALLDLKNVDGLLVLSDTLRFTADVENLVFDLSCYFVNEEGVISISDLDLYISGTFNAVIWFKPPGGDDWIPFTPFPATDGAVSLLINEKIKKPVKFKTPNNSAKLNFDAWYSPPINVSGGGSEVYTYNLSYGDGSYEVITTSDTEVTFSPREYAVGEYTASVTVSVDDSQVYDECLITGIEGGYCGHINIPPNKISQTYGLLTPQFILNYAEAEAEEDGNFHFSFIAKNNADEDHPYQLHWDAGVAFTGDWEGDDWIFDPPSGILNETEEQLINVTAPPPYDHKDHIFWPGTAWPGLNNTNYEHYPDEGEDGSGTEVRVFDGFVWINPIDPLRMPDLKPGEPRTSAFLIKNVYSKQLNWSIDTSELSPNGTWEFASLTGTLPTYGSAPIWFNVTANDLNLDLSSYINVTNQDDSSDFDTLFVWVKSRSEQQSLPPGVEIIENGDNVTVKIGGYNIVEIDNLYINQMFLNGIVTIDMGEENWVYINYSKTGEKNISIEGTGEFSVADFILKYGDMSDPNISIDVSYLAGEFEFREGHSGNISLEIDESSTNVDIEIDMDYGGTELTLQGDFDVYISGEADGELWFDWNLNGETPVVDFGGDLYREGTFTISVVGLLLELEGVTVTADGLLISGSGGNITVSGEEINISAEIDTAIIQNLTIDIDIEEFPLINSPLVLHGVFDLTGNVGLTLLLGEEGAIEIDVDGDTTVSISEFLLNINNSKFVLSWSSLVIYAGADLYIGTAIDLSYLEITVDEPTYLSISSFDLSVNNGALSLGVASLYVEGYGSLVIGKGEVEIDASLTSLDISALDLSINSKKLSLSGDFDLSLSGSVYLKANTALGYFEINIDQGQGTVDIINLEFGAGNGKINVSATSVSVSLSASGYLLFDDKNLTASASGTLTANVQGFSLDVENGSHIVEIKFQLSLNANADLIKLYLDKPEQESSDNLGGFRVDVEGAGGSFILQNTNITYTNETVSPDIHHYFDCDYLEITLSGATGYLELIDKNVTIDATGQLVITITNLMIKINNSELVVDIPNFYVLLGFNVGKFIIHLPTGQKNNGGPQPLGPAPPQPQSPSADTYLKLKGSISLTGSLQDSVLTIVNNSFLEFYVNGNGLINIYNNFQLILDTKDMYVEIGWTSLQIDVNGYGTIILDSSNITVQTSPLGIGIVISNLHFEYEGSAILLGMFGIGAVNYIIDIPSVDFDLTAGVEIFQFDISSLLPSPALPSLGVSPKNSSIYIDDTIQLIAKNALGPITWDSSDDNIATVDSQGLVTGEGLGSAIITATSGDDEVNVTVNVIGNAPSDFYISPVSVTKFSTFQLTPHNFDGEEEDIEWSSSNPEIVSVDENGVVETHRLGTVTITAKDSSQATAESTIYSTGDKIELSLEGDIEVSGNGGVYFYLNSSSGEVSLDVNIADLDVTMDNFDLSLVFSEMKEDLEEVMVSTVDAGWTSLSISGPASLIVEFREYFKLGLLSFDYINLEGFYLYLVGSIRSIELDINSIQANDLSCSLYYSNSSSSRINFVKTNFESLDDTASFTISEIVFYYNGLGPGPLHLPLEIWWTYDECSISGSGDIEVKRYRQDPDERDIYWRIHSDDGFDGEILRDGLIFGWRTINRNIVIGPGTIAVRYKLTNDGFIFINTEGTTFSIDAFIKTYILGFALRMDFKGLSIEADNFCIQWDNIFPPQNVDISGTIDINPSGELEIDVGRDPEKDGTYVWYDLELPPVPEFTYYVVDKTLYVDATDSYDLDGDIEHYYWKWTALQITWNELGPITSHTYATHGWKTVKLKVKDNDGHERIEEKEIYV